MIVLKQISKTAGRNPAKGHSWVRAGDEGLLGEQVGNMTVLRVVLLLPHKASRLATKGAELRYLY